MQIKIVAPDINYYYHLNVEFRAILMAAMRRHASAPNFIKQWLDSKEARAKIFIGTKQNAQKLPVTHAFLARGKFQIAPKA